MRRIHEVTLSSKTCIIYLPHRRHGTISHDKRHLGFSQFHTGADKTLWRARCVACCSRPCETCSPPRKAPSLSLTMPWIAVLHYWHQETAKRKQFAKWSMIRRYQEVVLPCVKYAAFSCIALCYIELNCIALHCSALQQSVCNTSQCYFVFCPNSRIGK